MGQWFGSSGVRGTYAEISPSFGFKLGIAVGETFKLKKSVYIASDIRATGSILKFCFMSGYSSVSGDIIDIGLNPTPILSYISDVRDTLGIMITASHNPPGNNGFKLFWKGGECSEAVENQVETKIQTTAIPDSYHSSNLSKWDSVGTGLFSNPKPIVNSYLELIADKLNIDQTDQSIVIDCANNVPNFVTPLALKKLGFQNLIEINKNLDPTFPGRPSEPTEENLQGLISVVIDENADLGIAHDGDGDRFAIIDEKGKIIRATTLINIFLDHLDYSTEKNGIIYLTSDCTNEAVNIAAKHGATVKISRIGRNREYINEVGVIFLAEPNKLIFPELGKWIDGLYPALKLLEILGTKKLSSITKKYDKRKILRKAFNYNQDKWQQIQGHIQNLPSLWSDQIEKVIKTDGLKFYLKNNSSVLIRFSGTEPKVKFYLESDTNSANAKLLSKLKIELNLDGYGLDC
jgi:phosphoglucosamine mutase